MQKFLKGLLLVFMVASTQQSLADEITVQFKTDFSRALLDEVCSGRAIDEVDIRNSQVVIEMINHFGNLRSDFTIEAYVAARRAAANCETIAGDIFRFADVIQRRADLLTEIDDIAQSNGRLDRRATKMISALSPQDMNYNGEAVLMIGTPSCGGWSVQARFYVDVPCLKGDQEGLLFLAAHEIFHGIQDQFMGLSDDTAPAVIRLFDATIREGTAQNLADFTKIERPGAYAVLNQQNSKKNQRRMQENFDLLEVLSAYLAENDDPEAFSKAYTIGASGLFDSPLYAVGEEMTQLLRQHYGDQAVVCLMSLPPSYYFRAYDQLTSSRMDQGEIIRLGQEVITALNTSELIERKLRDCIISS